VARQLPPALDRERHGLDGETAFARTLTVRERVDIVALVCRATARELAMNPRRDALLAHRDPCPPSTRAALRRLRAASVAGCRDGSGT
jgi:hypothetical protein